MVRGLCPRDMIRGEEDVTGRAVGNVGAIGHAKRPQPVKRGRHATQGWACRWGGARNRRCPSTDGRRTGDGAPYDVWGTFPHCKYVVRYPTEGASGTPPPTGVS